jgi:hypothetical protein
MRTPPQRLAAVLLAVAVGSGLVACSSDDSSSASTCKALQDVAASLRAFGDLNVVDEGASGIESAVDDVRSAVQQARDDASDQFADDFDALDSAIADLQSAVSDGRGDQSVGEWLSALGDDAGAVADAGRQLRDDAESELSDCDLSG